MAFSNPFQMELIKYVKNFSNFQCGKLLDVKLYYPYYPLAMQLFATAILLCSAFKQ